MGRKNSQKAGEGNSAAYTEEYPVEGKSTRKAALAVIFVSILVIIGACVWFFLFYTQKEAAENTAESAPAAAVASPDLAFNDLKGPVEFVRQYDVSEEGYAGDTKEFFFDRQGNWINIPTWNGNQKAELGNNRDERYIYDSDGYITKYYDTDGWDYGMYNIVTVDWDNGKVTGNTTENFEYDGSKDGYSTIVNTYDSDGRLVQTTENYVYPGGSNNTNITNYTYKKFDDYGNWTEREASRNSGSYTYKYTDRREIIYY